MRKILTTVAAATIAVTGVVAPALAEYPEKPVNFIVPWPPGDLEDVLTRMIAEDFQKEYGVLPGLWLRPEICAPQPIEHLKTATDQVPTPAALSLQKAPAP